MKHTAARWSDLDLRRIDPTSGGGDRSRSASADRMLTAVLATPREADVSAQPDARPPAAPRRPSAVRRRRWVATGLATAAVAATVAVVPALTGREPSAFASWTPEPTPLSAQESAALQTDCLAGAGTTEADGSPSRPTGGLAEARGLYTYTLVATAQGVSTCFALDPAAPGYDDPDAARTVASWLPADWLPQPAADGTTVTWGGNVQSPSGTWTWAVGRAGPAVRDVVLVDGDGRRVHATVSDGYLAAWWPGTGHGELTVQATLVDGSTSTRQVPIGGR
jgi:hypothetical protein